MGYPYQAPSIITHAATHEDGGTDEVQLDSLAPPDDTTDLDVSVTAHGLVPKAPNDATQFLDGTGAWSVPASGGGITRLSRVVDWREDFIGGDSSGTVGLGEQGWDIAGSLPSDRPTASMEAGHPGIIVLGGTYASDYKNMHIDYYGVSMVLTDGMVWEAGAKCAHLGNATNQVIYRVGLGNSTAGGDHSDGVYFEYDYDTSANWYMCCANNSARTKTDTGIAATTGWVSMMASYDATAGAVSFYLDGVLAGTVSTNIPTARSTTPSFQLVTGAGAGGQARYLYCDYFHLYCELGTTR
jgi:hypothetical protein